MFVPSIRADSAHIKPVIGLEHRVVEKEPPFGTSSHLKTEASSRKLPQEIKIEA